MTSHTIFLHILPKNGRNKPFYLHEMAEKRAQLPHFVRNCPVAMRYLDLLSPLAWSRFPERSLKARGRHDCTLPYASFAAAHLVKLEEGIRSAGGLLRYLREHPGLCWLFGFKVHQNGFIPQLAEFQTSLPHKRHFNRVLREIPNTALQVLLDSSVQLLQMELTKITQDFGKTISLDTKLILAWVAVGMPLAKENNPKAYVKERFNPNKQPKGDPDCRLGVKRRRNISPSSQTTPSTPTENPVEGSTVFSKAEYYWGYATGVVATKVPDWGEVVLAEMTQPFNRSDISYFFPLMDVAERRLGFRPHYGAFDCGYDAWYVYEYFHSTQHDGFAAVPLAEKGGYSERFFDPDGLPLCQAGLAMPLKFTFTDRTRALIDHERGKYVCPLLHPETNGKTCPVDHDRWEKGGCTADMPTSIGTRIRYQLDRDSDLYEDVYNQRTATERINSQAKGLGIERPHLRNQQAIANQNTLIYILINLRTLDRIRRQKIAHS